MHLTTLDPTHESDYAAGAAGYRKEIEEIDQEIRQSLNQVSARRVLAIRPVWGAVQTLWVVAAYACECDGGDAFAGGFSGAGESR